MRDRSFGVELEFDSNGLGLEGVADLLENNGYEHWIGKETHYDYYNREFYSYGGLCEDGSEVELKTPILTGKRGFNELFQVVKLLNKRNCYTTQSDGLHVHHDAPEFVENKQLIVKLLKSWKYNERHIMKFVDENRADYSMNEKYNSPCPTFEYESIVEYENSRNISPNYNLFERNNLNINALNAYGSIEFRLHEGTLNWEEIESWILFGQSFLNGVLTRKNPVMPMDNPVILLNRLKTNKRAAQFLSKKSGMVMA